jgi:PAS domain S-box-containing protein/putative nucleotidyltransferase with HDIG domain
LAGFERTPSAILSITMAVPLRLLVVEDSENDTQLLVREIQRGGYDVEFERVETAAAVHSALTQHPWDLIICDYSLPTFDAPRVLELLKASGLDLPFIISSGTINEETAVTALKAGAHDFMIKTNLTRLVPAIQRELKDVEVRRERRKALEALKESEERFRLIVDAVQSPIVVVDSQGKITLVNTQTLKTFGYTREEMLGQPVELLVPHKFQMQHMNDRKSYLSEPTNRQMHERGTLLGLHKDGHQIPIEIGLTTYQSSEGRFILAMILDITERRKAEEALRESEQRYRGLFEDSPISIWEEDFSLVKKRIDELRSQGIKDFKAYFKDNPQVVAECASLIKVLDVNNVSVNLYRAKSKADLLGNLDKILKAEEYSSFQNELINIAEGHTDFQWVGDNQTLEGDHVFVHLHWSIIRGYEDTLSRVIVSIIDITENKKAENALREAETRNRTLIEQLPMIVYVNSPDDNNHTTYVSPQIEAILGYTPQTWLADPLFWQKRIHPEDRQLVLDRIKGINRTGETFDMVFRMLASDGHLVWMRDQAIPIQDAEGRTVYWQGLMIDITEPKQREHELGAIAKLSEALRETLTVKEILPHLIDEALSLIGTDMGSIWLYDAGSAELSMTIQRGWPPEPLSKYPPGQNIPDLVVARREAIVAREFRIDPRVPEEHRKRIPEGVGGACVPLLASNTIIGAMFVNVKLPREITPGELRVLNALAEIGGSAIHRANLFEQTVKQLDRLAALRSIDIAISSSFDLKMTLNVVLDKVTRELNVDAADILLIKPESYVLEFAAGLGFWTRTIEATSLSIGEGLAGKAALERTIIFHGDLAENKRLVKRGRLVEEEKFVSYYAVPLVSKGKIKGVLEIFSRTAISRDNEWQQFLDAVAGQTAIAIDSSSLFQDLQRSHLELALAYDATIEGWSQALDLRDKETEGHTLRVTDMTIKLAQAMGINDEQLVHIRRGSLLHDIGKMGVPDRILLKPDKLTEDEWVSMHKHPEFAYKMLTRISYLQPALEIPYCHHEKWDGTGYPRGLVADQIPLSARIFAVVDVWDALLSDRPYRPGWKTEEVLKYIKDQSGKHFDPKVVDVFLRQVDKP